MRLCGMQRRLGKANEPMKAFISHLTKDRHLAGELKEILKAKAGADSFLAHEDVGVSEEWREAILDELIKADLLFAILSKGYFESPWCNQEIGIAASRKISIVPFSLDGTVPLGFASHIQSKKLKDGKISEVDVIHGLVKHDPKHIIRHLIDRIGEAGSFDSANARFDTLAPYIGDLSEHQAVRLLEY